MNSKFPNGLTVKELKELMKDWPEEDEFGEPCEVWLETSDGHSNIVKHVIPLNRRVFDDNVTFSADLLLGYSN
jgi:hypothetical protein